MRILIQIFTNSDLNNLILIMSYAFFFFLLFTYVIDGCQLSDVTIIKWLQIFAFWAFILLIIYFYIVLVAFLQSPVYCSDVNNSDVTVTVIQDIIQPLAKSLRAGASNLGIGAALGGGLAAGASLVKKTSLPMSVKVVITIGLGASGAVISVSAENYLIWLNIVQSGVALLFSLPRPQGANKNTKSIVKPFQTKILSVKSNSTKVNHPSLDPNWVTGFTDAEGSFGVYISQRKGTKYWSIVPSFEIGLHSKDLATLYKIKDYFGVGSISIRKTRAFASFKVSSISDLKNKIIPHYTNFPLQTQKRVDFNLWVKIINLIDCKEHLTVDGLNKILELKSALNRGLSKSTAEFTSVKALERPLHLVQPSEFKKINPMWLVGFTDGAGSFGIKTMKRANGKYQIGVRFRLAQHIRDHHLLTLITEYLGCGKVYLMSGGLACSLEVFSYSDMTTKIIPFFETHSLLTEKAKDFKDLTLVSDLIKNKEHLTVEGLAKINKIKSNINMNRS